MPPKKGDRRTPSRGRGKRNRTRRNDQDPEPSQRHRDDPSAEMAGETRTRAERDTAMDTGEENKKKTTEGHRAGQEEDRGYEEENLPTTEEDITGKEEKTEKKGDLTGKDEDTDRREDRTGKEEETDRGEDNTGKEEETDRGEDKPGKEERTDKKGDITGKDEETDKEEDLADGDEDKTEKEEDRTEYLLSPEEVLASIGDVRREDLYQREEDIPFSVYAEKLHNISQENHIVNQILTTLRLHRIAVLTSPPGGGKSTAAWLVLRRFRNYHPTQTFYFSRPQSVNVEVSRHDFEECLLVIDDFLGKARLDGFNEWKGLWEDISRCMFSDRQKRTMVLLVTRSNVLQDALQTFAMDLKPLIGRHNIVKLDLNVTEFMEECYPSLKNVICSNLKNDLIGLPLCCKLYSIAGEPQFIKADNFCTTLLEHLKTELARMMDEDKSLKEAFKLLALEDHPVTLNKFEQNLDGEGNAGPLDFTKNMLLKIEEHSGGWVQETGGFFSFLNDIVRALVLTVLCEDDPNPLVEGLSVKTICQRVAVSSQIVDTIQGYVCCSEEKASGFANRLFDEIARDNFSDVLSSPLLQHVGFREGIIERLKKDNKLPSIFSASDAGSSLGYMFWAGALTDFLLLAKNTSISIWAFKQIILGCCHFGHEKPANDLLTKTAGDLCKSLLTSTLKKLVDGTSHSATLKTIQEDWDKIPLHEDDTLLTLAASRGHGGVVKCLLKHLSLSLNSRGKDSRTMLMHFSVQGNDEMVRFLLDSKANATLEDVHGNTALHYACMAPCTTSSLKLVTKCNINKANKQGLTPLMIACQRESFQSRKVWYQELLQHQAFISTQDVFGRSVLHHACSNGDKDLVSTIANGTVFFGKETITKVTPLRYLLYRRNCDKAVHTLIDVKGEGIITQSDIVAACWVCDRATVERMLSVYQKTHSLAELRALDLPLQATFQDHQDVFEFIIEKLGENLRKTPQGSLALHFAAMNGAVKYVNALLEMKFDINKTDCFGRTPLMLALALGRLQMVNHLLQNSASTDCIDTSGRSCMFWAVHSECPLLMKLLADKDVGIRTYDHEGNTPLHFACQLSKIRAARFLLPQDPGAVLIENHRHLNCLHLAAQAGSLPLIMLFAGLFEKLGKNIRSSRGVTPLMIACNFGQEETARFLGTKTEDFLQKDILGWTPLHYAVQSGNRKVIELCLLHHQDGINAKTESGTTPEDIAMENGDEETLDWLQSHS